MAVVWGTFQRSEISRNTKSYRPGPKTGTRVKGVRGVERRMAFRTVRMTGSRLKAICTTLLPEEAMALASWNHPCPCPSTEHCLVQEAMGTYISSSFISLPVSVFSLELL